MITMTRAIQSISRPFCRRIVILLTVLALSVALVPAMAQDEPQPFSVVLAVPYGLNPDERLEAAYYGLGDRIAEIAEEHGVPLEVVYLESRSGSVTALDISASRENGIVGFYPVFTQAGLEATARLYLPSFRYDGLRTLFRTEGAFPEMTMNITDGDQFETLATAAAAQIIGVLGDAEAARDLYENLLADVEGSETDSNVAALYLAYGDLLMVTELTARVIDGTKSDGLEAAAGAYLLAFTLAEAGEPLEAAASLRMDFVAVVLEAEPLSLVANVPLPEFAVVDENGESASELLASMASLTAAVARNSRDADMVLDVAVMIEEQIEDLPDEADPEIIVRLQSELGHLYSYLAIDLGDPAYFEPAIQAYEAAGQSASGIDDTLYFDALVRTGFVYQNYAVHEDALFNLFNARAAYEDALDLPETDDLAMRMYAYINLGRVFQRLSAFVDMAGNIERAIDVFDDAIEVANELDPDAREAIMLHVERAQALAAQAFLSSEAAIPVLKEAISDIETILDQIDVQRYPQDYANALITLARIRSQYANHDGSDVENYTMLIQRLEQGLQRLGEVPDTHTEAILLYHLGYGYIRHGRLVDASFESDYETGIGILVEARALVDTQPVTFDYGSILYELYTAYFDRGNQSAGCEALEAFVQYFRDIDEAQDASYEDLIEQYDDYYHDTCERFL